MSSALTTLGGLRARARTRSAAWLPPNMKLRILLGAVLWTTLITFLHLWANVGLTEFAKAAKVWFGIERQQLRVGFLPVT